MISSILFLTLFSSGQPDVDMLDVVQQVYLALLIFISSYFLPVLPIKYPNRKISKYLRKTFLKVSLKNHLEEKQI